MIRFVFYTLLLIYSIYEKNSFHGGSFFDDKKKVNPFTAPGTVKNKQDTYYKSLPCLYEKIGYSLVENVVTREQKSVDELEPYEKRDICENPWERYYDEATNEYNNTVTQTSQWEDPMEEEELKALQEQKLKALQEQKLKEQKTVILKVIPEFFKTDFGSEYEMRNMTIHDITISPIFLETLNTYFDGKHVKSSLFNGREYIFHEQLKDENINIDLLDKIDPSFLNRINVSRKGFERFYSKKEMNAKIRMKNIIIDIFIYQNNRNDSSLFCKILIYYDNKTYLYRNRKITSNDPTTKNNIQIKNGKLIILFMDKTHKSITLNTNKELHEVFLLN